MTKNIEFVTDTATLCIFDLAALRHRLEDDCDWWTDPDEELRETNEGNAAFIGLGDDGKYGIEFVESLSGVEDCSLVLSCPSGRVFLGAGGEVTGDGLEPEAVRGGTFLEIQPSKYRLAIKRISGRIIAVCLQSTNESGQNQFTLPIRV